MIPAIAPGQKRKARKTAGHLAAVLAMATLAATGCINDEDVFTDGRLENLCLDNIPACNTSAQCVLKEDQFFRGEFGGGIRMLARTQFDESTLIVGFLFTEQIDPGTELQVEVFTPDCGDFEEEHPKDRDLFELAGDDRTLFFELDMPGRGDHMVQIFSDMNAEYLLRFEIEEKR